MRILKRLVSTVLAGVMTLSLVGVPAMAADTPPYEGDHTGTITVTVRDSVSQEALPNARVQLEDITAGREQVYEIKQTGQNGQVSWTGLSSGQYRITQITAPDNYKLNTKVQSLWLDTTVNPTRTMEIANDAESALYIYRYDPDANTNFKALPNAHFKVATVEGVTVASGITGANGCLTIPHLPDGTYLITETQAPDGYQLSSESQKVTIEAGKGPYIKAFYGRQSASITIIVRDSVTREGIAGTTWEIKEANGNYPSTTAANLTTNEAGLAYLGDLSNGTYIITQKTVANGYINKMETATVQITNEIQDVVQTFYNTPYGNVTAYVSDSTTAAPLAGVTFTLYDSDNKIVQGPTTSNVYGEVNFLQVASGNYRIVAKAPSGYVMDVTSIAVSVTGGATERVPFTATQQGSIRITSYDASNPMNTLPGTGYKVTKMDGTVVGTYATGADGSVLVSPLENGTYIVTQTSVPDGFVMVNSSKTIQVKAGIVTPADFYNRARPFVTITTLIDGTDTAIAGCRVSLVNEKGEEVASGTTAEDGTITFENLNPGTYTAKLIGVPDGYTVKIDSTSVQVTTSKAGTAVLTAEKHSAIVVKKLDSKTAEPLSGAMFIIRDSLGAEVETLTTGIDGTAATQVLKPGKYSIQEMFAPDGYVPNTTARTVTVENNKTTQATFTNTEKSAIVVYAYDKAGSPIPNVPYIVYNALTSKEVAQLITDEGGVASTDKLAPGNYMVTEATTPSGYNLVNPTQAHIILDAGEATYVRFIHVPLSTIQMQTVDAKSGAAITGAVYQIVSANGDYKANFSTDENGEAITKPLTPGTYYVKQIEAADGYLLNTTTQTITVTRDQVNLAKFHCTQMSRIVIQCTVQGSEFGLDSCTFTVEDSTGKEVFHGTTDASGLLTTGNLTPGKYTVKQIAVKDGYSVVQRERTVTVTQNEATTVKFEQVAHTSIVIQLTDAQNKSLGLAGAKFQIEQQGGTFKTEVTTNSSGTAITSELPAGTYMVHQMTAPEGYLLDQSYQWAKVTANAVTKVEFVNNRISGIVLQALTQDTHVGIAGAVFEIYHENGKLVKTVTTDATGIINITDLTPDIYLIKEATVPDGYTAVTTSQKVTVTVNEATTITFYHTAQSALTVNLKDENTSEPLANGVFRVYKANGDLVGEYTTNASGQFVIATLPAGKYTVEQIKAPDGYVLDTTPKYVTIKDNQSVTLDVTNAIVTGLRIINTCEQTGKPIYGNTFKITTYDGKLVGNYTTNTSGIINVTLQPGTYTVYQTYVTDGYVLNSQSYNVTIKAGVGSTLEVQNQQESRIIVRVVDKNTGKGIYNVNLEIKDSGNNYIGRFKTDNNGYIYLDDVLTAGRYKVTMISAPDGYVLDTVPKTIVVNVGKTTELTWKIEGKQGQVTIVTYAGEDSAMMQIRKNSKIPGAVYSITDASGRVVGTIQGDVNGEAHTGALSIGTYYIQQTTPPTGYQLNTGKLTVNVTSSNDNIRVEVYNRAAVYNMTVSAHGQATAVAGGQVKYYFSNIKNASTSNMNNFYISIKLPSDAMRAVRFDTGTFNYQTYYNIQYKTNLTDWRTLAQGCNSKSNYNYDLSTRGLGLSNGEYVTDVRMVFPTVISGFAQSMSPTLLCQVLSTVPTGYQAQLRVEVGGQGASYGNSVSGGWANGGWNNGGNVSGGWYTGAGSFTTYIYGQNINYPSRLPKTGY